MAKKKVEKKKQKKVRIIKRKPKQRKKPNKQKKTLEARQEAKTLAKGGKTIRIYGHEVDRSKITNAAIEAHAKRRYSTNEIQVQEYITNPHFHNLMIKIAVLDRIEEELVRLFSDAEVDRINAVTIIVR